MRTSTIAAFSFSFAVIVASAAGIQAARKGPPHVPPGQQKRQAGPEVRGQPPIVVDRTVVQSQNTNGSLDEVKVLNFFGLDKDRGPYDFVALPIPESVIARLTTTQMAYYISKGIAYLYGTNPSVETPQVIGIGYGTYMIAGVYDKGNANPNDDVHWLALLEDGPAVLTINGNGSKTIRTPYHIVRVHHQGSGWVFKDAAETPLTIDNNDGTETEIETITSQIINAVNWATDNGEPSPPNWIAFQAGAYP